MKALKVLLFIFVALFVGIGGFMKLFDITLRDLRA